MKAQPLVSIVVLSSRSETRHLRRALDSALSQTYPSVETFLAVDQPSEATSALASDYASRIAGMRCVEGGEAAACNAGFAATRGDIVLFLEADDTLYPQAVERVVAAWRDGVVKIHFPLDEIDERGHLAGRRVPELALADEAQVHPVLRRYGFYPAPPLTGNAFSRMALAQVMPVPEQPWQRCIAAYLAPLAALYGRVRTVAEPLGACRAGRDVGDVDLAELRWMIAAELDRENALKAHAERIGEPIQGALSLRVPAHCKARLVSLLLDRGGHPVEGDGTLGLVWAGIRAALRFPYAGTGKRLLSAAGFLALPLLPERVLRERLDELFIAERRPDLFGKARALVGAAAGEPVPLVRQPGT
jgi:hypothetical protein